MKALQLTSNQCFYRGKVGLSEFHYSGGSTSKVHASTESDEALCEYYEEKKDYVHTTLLEMQYITCGMIL